MSDDALLHEFNRARSERAFEALVQRHLRLVFATALRQVGDRSLAEEISQQVFLALARKAGRLGGHQTIAGWLYQTTLREAKRALRTELRRQRRDQLAVEVGALNQGAEDEGGGLLPLLDEALSSLRESERLAVILRYFEGKSWREVGTELGVSEDAVQKRGERALEALGRFFARHGFKVSAGTLTTGLITQASAAVPVTLVGVITQSALVPAASTSTVGALALHFMNLTKTQTAVATLLVCAAPIAFEVSSLRATKAQELAQAEQFASLAQAASDQASDRLALEQRLVSLDRTLAELAQPLPAVAIPKPASTSPAPSREAGWQDALPYVEVPKEVLGKVLIPTFNNDGRLRAEIVDALAMTAAEVREVQAALDRQRQNWQGSELAAAHYEPNFQLRDPAMPGQKETLTYRFPALPEQGVAVREQLEESFLNILGSERGNLLLQQSESEHGSSLNELFNGYAQSERTVTLIRTGQSRNPVRIRIGTMVDGVEQSVYSYPFTPTTSEQPSTEHHVPSFLQPLALRWYYSDYVEPSP